MHVLTFSSVRALLGLLLPSRLSAGSEFSQLHQQPVCYKLPSIVTFTFIQTFDQDFVFFTKGCHGLQGI